MKSFSKIISTAIVVETENIDTDQIIPAVFLKTTVRTGLGKYLFYNWRYETGGKFKKHIFNEKKTKGAKILAAGKNFGSGSSREHAVWALTDFGFKVIISSTFGDIFYNNSLKNGLLCIKLNDMEISRFMKIVKTRPDCQINVELKKQEVKIPEIKIKFNFEIDAFRKYCLLSGTDELGYILSHEEEINTYEKNL
ncbi:MAG: 3-isopropylmalate dehydratase small subunit, 3-isopropylmalate/(R)-2-methylmalate dehydratase small subunit [Candidatus Gottesmanbacteria bacterium GW2011_GWA2_43_14]|uniref:3-isopropylmalate dehydratase small subunit n=1 Tax=Candidatus Gottesmanbacteria bacterium GW2011_GWA2_43_14 TaxID=1618443 RepID=A0A0G1DET9_9BACT|nr:MAG: 3-isopropylmalate dehydratase small subunit, 3-isopropylmalate/(R)-2-methylmalate dehydratase small subunit [Candidatus Gottesmanbacteria bacterium GW2011_GWA2_43_14]